ncbi:hypothetical protein TKK_0015286 [Trichogramma kaykai]
MARISHNNNSANNNPASDCIKIISINVNSIVSLYRRNNLEVFIKKHKPDILTLCETKLNNKHKLAVNNYTCYRNYRNENGGGIAILVNNRLWRVYMPHPQKNISIINDLDKLFNNLKLDNIRNDYVIIGELNAKHKNWNNVSINSRGRELNRRVFDVGMMFNTKILFSLTPTLYKANSFIALVKSNIITPNYLTTHNYESDHRAIELSLKLNFQTAIPPIIDRSTKFLYKKTNTKKFLKYLEKNAIEVPSDRTDI